MRTPCAELPPSFSAFADIRFWKPETAWTLLSVVKNHASAIQLAVTDVVMPRMSGGELAKELEILRPETRLLFVSGYAGQTVVDHKVADVENNFLQKPFTLKQLASKVRTVLDYKRVAVSIAPGAIAHPYSATVGSD